ncbi:Tic20 family protein [Cronbergia sp. UHCC 0137]|uniref:Tic20 family protein n=1 Tax=Cronbergia sp. UHCC 0137 TaxID=3110239 RepID=UPI002B1EA877|nr:Tic20 family protein [Cronbergia sp. UHCC 0137]MEA5620655.1 Tic20 family protein [Cronbergia sp. UHCC 0137]
MSWRGSITVPDRIFACLPYLLPLIECLIVGSFLLRQFPLLAVLFLPLQPVLIVYGSLGQIGQLILFFALFVLVVRNEKINHFIRFNTMQAILLNIVISLSIILLRILGYVPGAGFAIETLANTVFLGILAAVGYSVFQSIIGRYAEIPAISDAVYTQVR